MSRRSLSKSKVARIARTEQRSLFELNNGLTVVLHNMPHRKATTIGIWVPVGSAVEKENEAGYSHFVEHMLFKGTKRRSYSDISREIDRLGGYINASTSREKTVYYITLSGRYLKVALDILADMYFESVFAPKEFNTEKKVILEEIKMSEDDPDDYIADIFFNTAYPDNPMGRPIGGSIESISDSSRKKLLDFYYRRYGTAGAVLSLAGGLYQNDKEKIELEKTIRRLFDRTDHPLGGSPSLSKIQYPQETSNRLYHKQKNLEQVHFIIGLPAEPFMLTGFAPLEVFSNLMGGSMSSRLFRKLREERGLCYSVGCQVNSFHRTGLWTLYCATSAKNFAEAVKLALQETRLALAKKLAVEEVRENTSNIVGSIELSMESPQYHARFNANSLLYTGELPDWEMSLEEIEAVTPQAIREKMLSLWKGQRITLASLGNLPGRVTEEVQKLVSEPII